MSIPQAFIQELLARADVVEVVGRHVQLKKSGANYMGLCPFHAEKSPSFCVSPTRQTFHCFGCGAHGSALGFLMDHAGMSYVEAIESLAQEFGLQVPEDGASGPDRARAAAERQRQATLSDVLAKAAGAYRRQLRESPRAIDYLKGRGLSGEIAARFGLGYAPPGWRTLAGVFPDYDDPLLTESGLVITGADDADKRYDRFRDRIMFPIRNVRGECIAFGGRVLGDEKPKYLNSPETPVFHKGRELYGLFEARASLREHGFALVTEGYMDVVALAQLGFPNAVATLGTACTGEHVQKLFRHTDSVVFSFDGDAAGRTAARRALDAALPHAGDRRSVRFLFLPDDHDPDSYIRAFGRDAFARALAEALPLSRFMIDAAREGCDLAEAEGRARLASNAAPLWRALPQGALRRQLLGELAGLVQLAVPELAQLWGDEPAGAPRQHATRQNYQNNSNPRMFHTGPVDDSLANPARGGGFAPRAGPSSRADHAARILLARLAAWDGLSSEDHALLCALPPPHGPLFAWLESQLLEHGAQPWAALREGLRGHASEALALKAAALLQEAQTGDESAADDALDELRGLLNGMHIDRLKRQETEALDANDPERYRRLHAQRLERAGAGSANPS
ncbi:MAG: DNA primase DnaG [Burkholderiaceae bacterium]|nr:MAG: DNA primase DnaG [Burkholderiaceae bacterium]